MQRLFRTAPPLLTAVVACTLVALTGPTLAVGGPAASPVLSQAVTDFWPPLEGAASMWFAIVVILALSIQLKPLLCQRNLDALVLAATCLLLTLRSDVASVSLASWDPGHTGQWWSYLLLSVAAGYWLLRGLRCLLSSSIRRHESNVSDGAMLILVLAGLAVGVGHLMTSPLSAGSRDGIVGGICMADTGKLPYGEAVGHDSRSPLLYLVHAGAVRLRPPTTGWTDDDSLVPLEWECRDWWVNMEWWRTGEFAAARLVNAVLFILFLLALHTIGRRLHSVGLGLTVVTIFCILPMTAECLPRPEIMLPAVLLSWSVALALVPGIGGLASGLLIVLAGFAWPWAWLALPVLLGYFFRHGWESVGVLVGTLGGIAVGVAGLVWLTQPTLPRADGALHRADLHPTYVVSRSDQGAELTISPREGAPPPERGWLRPFWRFLIDSENLVLDTTATGPDVSPVDRGDVDARKLVYRNLEPTAEAREELTQRYRAALAPQPAVTRMWVAVRTVLEQTWLAADSPEQSTCGVWELWGRGATDGASRLPTIRKVVKLAVGVLAILIGLVMLRGARPRPRHLVGGLLAISSATLLASDLGAVTNIVWLLPMLLALWAVNEQSPESPSERQKTPALPDVDAGLPPRISVET